MKQIKLFKNEQNIYGGSLRNKRKGREGPRPLATRNSMHLTLKSSKAVGVWSFSRHRKKVDGIIQKFCKKYGIKLYSMADGGNHLHLHFQLGNRFTYKAFIRAVTAAIAMAITGASRWNKLGIKFWDYRPYSRVVIGFKAFLTMRDYIIINQLESAHGFDRTHARLVVKEFARPVCRSG